MRIQKIDNNPQSFGMAKLGKNLEALFSYAKKDCKTGFDFEMLDKARRNFEELPYASVEVSKLYPKNFLQRIFSGPKDVVQLDDKLSFTINPLIKPRTKLEELAFVHNGTMRGIQDDFYRRMMKENLEQSRQAAKEAWKMLKQAIKEKFSKKK